MLNGMLLSGDRAVTPIVWPTGRFRSLLLFSDNGRERRFDPVRLRIAVWRGDQGYVELPEVVVDSTDGPVSVKLDEFELVGGVTIERRDNPEATVAWTTW